MKATVMRKRILDEHPHLAESTGMSDALDDYCDCLTECKLAYERMHDDTLTENVQSHYRNKWESLMKMKVTLRKVLGLDKQTTKKREVKDIFAVKGGRR